MWNKFYFNLSSLLMCPVNFWEGEEGAKFPKCPWPGDPFFEDRLRGLMSHRTSMGVPAHRRRVSEVAHAAQIASLRPGAQKKPLWSAEGPVHHLGSLYWSVRTKPFLVVRHLLGLAHPPPLGASQCDPSKSFLFIIINIRCGAGDDMQRHTSLLGKL